MRTKKFIVQIRNGDNDAIDIEIDQKFIDFYKKETCRNKVTLKGISKFLNHLIELHGC